MKKSIIIIAISLLAITVKAQIISPTPTIIEQTSQDRVKINPADLPQAVKTTISEKAETKDLQMTEAYQITNEEGEIHYEVFFDNAGEILNKKYNAAGEAVKEDLT
ncbi:hypothetical protein [Anditalea andensis]|uniref:Beta-lactamase-inhibitor-like PepSY-like domain-containing protein n=1 Tax=Anditalea andensis TaxID=1048983 RepID=A0A074KZW3_9BACT|nr:hypothetical protein [Anditalea andensis]KEO74474.1 hypothetical protein EL17_06975 [Anditalea andensis]